jgi:hypothetical protein
MEVRYGFMSDRTEEEMKYIWNRIRKLPVHIINNMDDIHFDAACRFKTTYRCSVCDAIGLGLAHVKRGLFVTADHHDLDGLADAEPGLIQWLR